MDSASKDGFHLKLWRGERMCLIGMDVEVSVNSNGHSPG